MSTQASGAADAKLREKRIEKIRALLAKTVTSGATEDEAISAAMMARRLMDQWGIDDEALNGAETGWDEDKIFASDDTEFRHFVELYGSVARYCDCFGFHNKRDRRVNFFGRPSDVVFAGWLFETLIGFINRGAKEYMANERPDCVYQSDLFGDPTQKKWRANMDANKRAELAFKLGAYERVAARLWKLAEERDASKRSDGRGLIVRSKSEQALDELKRRGLNFRTENLAQLSARDAAAHKAGKARGDSATFEMPVGAQRGGTLMIGSGR